MHHDYVQALVAVLSSGVNPDLVFANLKTVLERRGHQRLLPRILRNLELAEQRTGQQTTVLTVARTEDAVSPLVKQLQTALLARDEARIVVDSTVIGGAKLRANNQEIDATYKTALITLYQSITK